MAVVAFRLKDGRPAVLGLRPDSTSLAVDDVFVSSYDLAGRPYAVVRDSWTFRRALDGRLLQKGEGVCRVRRVLDADEGAPVLEAARAEARLAAASFTDGGGLPAEAAADARARLLRIVAMDEAALAADARRFAAVYRPVGMLPPDQYLAVVLQATEGCSWNRCTFCGLYRDTPFRAKPEEEFARHAEAVVAYFGEALALRRSVFLGDANALSVHHARAISYLETAGRVFAHPPRGIHAFVDVFTGARKTVDEYRDYARLGLRRVYVGLESGDPDLLDWLEKPGTTEAAVALVETLRAAGIAAGVIVLLGAGGFRFGEAHVRKTAEVLSRMRLGPEDLVYFSELVPARGAEYARRAEARDLQALPTTACAAQRRRMVALTRPGDPRRPPRTATYDLREFVY